MIGNIFPLCSQAAVQAASQMAITSNLIATPLQAAAAWIDDEVAWFLITN